MQARTNRSWTIAAASAVAGAAALSLGLFLAVSTDGLAEDKTKDKDKTKSVQVITVEGSDTEDSEAPEAWSTSWNGTGGKGGYLGLSMREDTKNSEGGALVEHVVSDSPAAKGGLKDGDVIVGFGGDVVRGPAKVSEKLRESKPGDKVVLDVRRDNRIQKVTVELGERRPVRWRVQSGDGAPMDEQQQKALEESLRGLDEKLPGLQSRVGKMKFFSPGRHGLMLFGNDRPLLGIEMVETTPELRETMGGTKDAGVLVGKVLSGTAAEKCGLKVGDLITTVDGKKVSDAGELSEAISSKEGKTVELDVVRDKRTMHMKAVLPKIDEPEDEPTGPRASLWVLPVLAPRAPVAPAPTPVAIPAPAVAPALPAPPAPPATPAPPTPAALSLVQFV